HFFDAFSSGIQKLTAADLMPFLQLNSNSLLQQVNSFLQNENISLENFVLEIKEAFASNKLISVNSKEESEEKQIAVNTLEQPDNLYRAVFAVDKLNEGWDVLNLFDIVRLYDTHQTAKTNAPIAKTTVAEAQLIGRGARYFPFTIGNNLPVFQRKFDTQASHPLRICEELYYHSPYNPAYIHELSLALQHTGIKAALSTLQPIELKTAFTQTPLYQHGFVWVNQQLKCPPPKQHALPNQLLKKPIAVNWFTGTEQTDTLFNLTPANEPAAANAAPANKHKMKLSSIEPAILRKAICQLPFFHFANLRAIFPKLNSISEFIASPHFLGGINLEIPTPLANLSITDKLNVAKTALQQIAHQLQKPTTAYMGSAQFEPLRLNKVITNKTVMIHQEHAAPPPNKLSLLAPQLPLYVLQPDDHLHQQTTQLLCNACQTLQLYFKEVYLLKNIGYITLYHTQNGAPVQPQYVLWLTSGSSDAAVYQIFIEISSSLPHLQPVLYHRSLQVLQNQFYHIVWIQTGKDTLLQPDFGEKLRAVLM
ncbi:MAG TPA: hypothetical protein PK715_13555, partial [Chitinophagales bacterium]|nr:hypothetical protein [Chitinophagales bacterium]